MNAVVIDREIELAKKILELLEGMDDDAARSALILTNHMLDRRPRVVTSMAS